MWVENEGVLGHSKAEGDVCLNRIFRWSDATSHTKEAIEIEADARRSAALPQARLERNGDALSQSNQRRCRRRSKRATSAGSARSS